VLVAENRKIRIAPGGGDIVNTYVGRDMELPTKITPNLYQVVTTATSVMSTVAAIPGAAIKKP